MRRQHGILLWLLLQMCDARLFSCTSSERRVCLLMTAHSTADHKAGEVLKAKLDASACVATTSNPTQKIYPDIQTGCQSVASSVSRVIEL